MKKYIAFVLGLVLGLGFVSCSGDDDDEKQNTNGNGKIVAEMTTTRYDWVSGRRSKQGEIYRVLKYNKKGQIVSTEYQSEGRKYEYIFDDEGKRIECNVVDRKSSYKYKFEYNSMGRESVEYKYNQKGELIETIKLEYDSNGNESVRCRYDSKDELVETVKSEYDDKRRLVKETTIYGPSGSTNGRVWAYIYGENTETRTFTNLKDGSLVWQDVDEKDSHHNTIKSIRTLANGDKILIEYTYEYDSKGRQSKIVGPIVSAEEGVNTSGLAHTKYWERSFNDDGLVQKEHIAVPADNEEYDLEYTYTYY